MALTLMQLKIILRNIVTNNCDLSNYHERTIAILIGNGYVVATGDEKYRVTQKAMKRAERIIWQSSNRPNDRSL